MRTPRESAKGIESNDSGEFSPLACSSPTRGVSEPSVRAEWDCATDRSAYAMAMNGNTSPTSRTRATATAATIRNLLPWRGRIPLNVWSPRALVY